MLHIKKAVLLSCFSAVVLGAAVGSGAGMPASNQCSLCHGFDDVYKEWQASAHGQAGVGCVACHIPGKKQEEGGLLQEGEKEGFHILGYQDGAKFVRLSGNAVCVRCHDGAHYVRYAKVQCTDCHMAKDGLTTYRVHTYPENTPNLQDPASISLQTVRKYVTRPHRVHTLAVPKAWIRRWNEQKK